MKPSRPAAICYSGIGRTPWRTISQEFVACGRVAAYACCHYPLLSYMIHCIPSAFSTFLLSSLRHAQSFGHVPSANDIIDPALMVELCSVWGRGLTRKRNQEQLQMICALSS